MLNNTFLIEKIKQRLLLPLPGITIQQHFAPVGRSLIPAAENTPNAGVMILLYPKDNELHTIFIQRTVYPGAHSGQVSFPGGMYEEKDTNLLQTALRETEEEIGVEQRDIQILGSLSSLYIPVSKIQVFPFVGYLKSEIKLNIETYEVEHVIETPLCWLQSPMSIQKGELTSHGRIVEASWFTVGSKQIWGATAMILAEFLFLIKEIETASE